MVSMPRLVRGISFGKRKIGFQEMTYEFSEC
jgi:hypothetical protein